MGAPEVPIESRTFPASVNSLYDMLGFVSDYVTSQGFKPPVVQKVELAAEEALINIVNYAGLGESGVIEIRCRPIDNPPGAMIILKDSGIPFDPLTNAHEIDFTTPIEQRALGGYGIYLITKFMDKVDYKREGGKNILTLIKYNSTKP